MHDLKRGCGRTTNANNCNLFSSNFSLFIFCHFNAVRSLRLGENVLWRSLGWAATWSSQQRQYVAHSVSCNIETTVIIYVWTSAGRRGNKKKKGVCFGGA